MAPPNMSRPACRPPRPPSRRRRSVAQWEKDFCVSCSVPWEKAEAAARRGVSPLDGWDDSAARDALRDAKARYWAKINGLRRDIPLLDSDMYSSAPADDDAAVDPELDREFEEARRAMKIAWAEAERASQEETVLAPEDNVPTGWDCNVAGGEGDGGDILARLARMEEVIIGS